MSLPNTMNYLICSICSHCTDQNHKQRNCGGNAHIWKRDTSMMADKFRAWFSYFATSLVQSISKGRAGDGVRCIVQPLLGEISGFCGELPKYKKHIQCFCLCKPEALHCADIYTNTVQTTTASIRLWR